MNKGTIYSGIVGVIVGAVVSGMIVANVNKPSETKKDDATTMASMTDSLHGKSGDEFDKVFISGMIEHHQGAVDMANLAKEHAKHDEIKRMADDIISAQTKEIDMMKSWQSQWGYSSNNSNMNHSSH